MANHTFDVVIIGGGNGGMGVTVPTRHAGLKVAMLEPAQLGGTCSNRGCTPKKVLVAAAHALDEIARAGAHHISVGPAKLDWAALIDREKHLIAHIPGSLTSAMERRGVHLVRAHGHFVTPNAVKAGGHIYEAENIVIATGSKPRPLAFPGAELMITSDDVLSDREQPRDVVFVGGGVIAFEFSHVYARAGTRVTMLQAGGRFLNRHDADAVARILDETRSLGIDARSGIDVKRIEPAGDRLRVVFEEDGMERTVGPIGSSMALAASPTPTVSTSNQGKSQPTMDDCRTTTTCARPRTRRCGSLATPCPTRRSFPRSPPTRGAQSARTSPTAPNTSRTTRRSPLALHHPHRRQRRAHRGGCRDRGLDIHVNVSDMREWLSGRTFNEPVAWAKVISERASGRIVGAHLVGHGGEELIHIFALAMKHGITTGDFGDMVYAFPTFAADLRHMV